jgi:hypothetical protein
MKWLRPGVTRTDILLIGLILALRLATLGVRSESEGSAIGSNSTSASESASINFTLLHQVDNISANDVNPQTESITATEYSAAATRTTDSTTEDYSTDRSIGGGVNEVWAKIRHLHQKVRLKDADQQEIDGHPTIQSSPTQEWDYVEDATKPSASGADEQLAGKKASSVTLQIKDAGAINSNPSVGSSGGVVTSKIKSSRINSKSNGTGSTKPFRILASGTRKSKLQSVSTGGSLSNHLVTPIGQFSFEDGAVDPSKSHEHVEEQTDNKEKKPTTGSNPSKPVVPRSFFTSIHSLENTPTGAPKLENKIAAMKGLSDADGESSSNDSLEVYDSSDAEASDSSSLDDPSTYDPINKPDLDIMTKFLRIVESQSLLGDNCTAGTDDTLGEGVVDRYAQERFRLEAEVAVNRANWLTRLWKYADKSVLDSEYLLHVELYSMIEMDEDIFAAGNCYDK